MHDHRGAAQQPVEAGARAADFADVVKHALLARIIAYLKKKEAAFRVIDTHSGAGMTDLHGEIIVKEAINQNTFSFNYDTQEYAYQEVFRLVDSAIVLLQKTDGAVDVGYYQPAEDLWLAASADQPGQRRIKQPRRGRLPGRGRLMPCTGSGERRWPFAFLPSGGLRLSRGEPLVPQAGYHRPSC